MIYLTIKSAWSGGGEACSVLALPDPSDEDAQVRAVVSRHAREGRLERVRVRREETPGSESFTEYEVLP